ncbi:MAG: prolyl oligopeptidase family serine peptidase [Gammaproteobacteria bacterium]|nr:prolyl oligopeptidase family serine peptidase [Gammaproteobacteria bacterium]NNM12712.1 S9 family peptidase [Gammaproteobacteria bacterium]
MPKHIFLIGALLLSFTAAADSVMERTANNGNLVMQDVPEIPQTLVDDLNRYQNVRSAPFRDFSNDGKSIFITTRFGDVSQIHRVDKPLGARQQLTFFKEPIGGIDLQPGTNNITFTMDAGGNEFSQIFMFDPATANSNMLTDGESRNNGVNWNHSGSHFAYVSTRRNNKSNDIWLMDPAEPQKTEILMESPDGSWWGVSDWSADDKHLLVQQYISASDSRIHKLELENRDLQLLAGSDENPSVNYSVAFDATSNGYFFITNRYSEFEQLAYQSFNSQEPTVITKNINWNVEGMTLSDNKDRAAFIVNQDGVYELYLLNPKNFKYKKVSGLPIGLIGGLEFSPDGKQLGLTLNTSQSASDSYVLSLSRSPLGYGKLTRWTRSEVGGLNTEKFAQPELIRYPSFDQRNIPAFMYKPEAEGPLPVIISIHGGPEAQFLPRFSSTFQLWIDKIGAAVIAPNVRGSAGYGKEYLSLDNGFKREDSVKDIGALLDWIETQPDLDSNRVAVIGGSYGGYMVLASTMHYSDRLKAAVDIVGISNFVTFLENTEDYRRDLRRVEYGDERDPEMRAHLEKISPNNHVDKLKIPLFVVQGQNDPRVPVTEAEQIVKALRDDGKSVWYMNALNEGHGYRKKENRDIYQQAVVMFLQEHLAE